MKGLAFLAISCLCFVQFAEGQTLMSTLISNCTAFQTFIGVNYAQLTDNVSDPDTSTLQLDLYTASKITKFSLSSAIDILSDPGYNSSLPISLIIHGFFTTPNYNSYASVMTTAFINLGKTNVLYLDASSLIFLFYSRAVTLVRIIGELLAVQLWNFVQAGVNPAKIHILGHSLGAHVAGFAGKKYITLSGGSKLPRITGMDPAGPCFFDSPSDQTLNATDATFVDVIHTDGGLWGIIKPLGQVDYYVNDGQDQPGSILIDDDHTRVWRIIPESILYPQNFIARKCPDWPSFQKGQCSNNPTAVMGYYATPGTTGIYYLRTGAVPQYGLGNAGTSPTAFTKWWWNTFA
nr:pancreatic lipase-like A4 [Limnephilus flavicornis]